MVTRKPLPNSGSALAPTNIPPHPTSPAATRGSAPFRPQDASPNTGEEQPNPWTGEDLDKLSLHGNGNTPSPSPAPSLPNALRAGPPPGYTPKSSQEKLSQTPITNPFLQKQQTGNSNHERESSTDAWRTSEKSSHDWGSFDTPAPPTSAPPPPPPPPSQAPPPPPPPPNSFPPESNTNPWGSAVEGQPTSKPPPIPSIPHGESGSDAWAAPRHAPPAPPVDNSQPVLVDLEESESPAWDEDEPSPVVAELPADSTPEIQQISEDRHAWDENEGHPLRQNPPNPTITTQLPSPEQPGEGWNLVDHELVQGGAQSSGVVGENGVVLETFPFPEVEPAPPLPPRRSREEPPPHPPRPVLDTTLNQSSSSLMSPGSAARKQKKETYEIKKITWHDVKSATNPRVSPILVQNANGPCPLLALVNALTLSTPADLETALVETLRTREQVSLGLLLDAVFDELMSGRRGDAVQDLPDVSDLYSFLITLHTGMNVNPRFLPNPPQGANDPRSSMSHVHPSEREAGLPGAFEETREMKLYSTFSIPLIHGWIPEADSPAYASLERSAQSYEDAQNLMFHEEELEYKLEREGLNFEEQGKLEDITTIKAFFSSYATQLTPFGLQIITSSIAPGSVAILFRNDHFSTLYRHPDTLQLLQLVTDMGYAGHEEVVWESLMDVNGENAEFFSGDFRLVGGAPTTPSTYHNADERSHNANDGWTTIAGRRTSSQGQTSHTPSHSYSSPSIPTHHQPPNSPSEQEDHDLALALQLQEEEEERHRAEQARRQRETELSQQYIEQQGRSPQNNNVPVTQRGGGRRQATGYGMRGRGRGTPPAAEVRPVVPPRRIGTGGQPVGGRPIDPEAGVDVPPPTYEQAAGQAAYVPPENHPSHPTASPDGGGSPGMVRRASAYITNSQAQGYAQNIQSRRGTGAGPPTSFDQLPETSGRVGRKSSVSQGNEGGRDKDCVVM